MLELPLGHAPGDRLPAPVARPWTRPPTSGSCGALVAHWPGRGAVLAVRERAEQHRPALGRDGRRVRRPTRAFHRAVRATDPDAAGRARWLRLRRAVEPARRRGVAVLRCTSSTVHATPSISSPCTSTTTRRASSRHVEAVRRADARSRRGAAGGGRRVQRPDVVRAAASSTPSCSRRWQRAFAGTRRGRSEHRRAGRRRTATRRRSAGR